jgi:O-antigen ligase
MLWKTALDEIREHPLAGTGTGDVMDDLMRRYETRQFLYALNNRLNPHNQYLHTWLATGLAGFLILLGCLVIPAVMAVRRSCYLYVFFLFLVGFNFLFESMLERQSGVVFYAFFNALLYKTKLSDTSWVSDSL